MVRRSKWSWPSAEVVVPFDLTVDGSVYAGEMTTSPQRVAVIGGSGAGKTTFARHLSEAIRVPHVELDALHWDVDWTPTPAAEFRERVERALKGERWVVDGNYQSKLGTRILELSDTVIWLDPGRATIMRRVIGRTWRRAVSGEELWNGNRETWAGFKLWRRDESIIWWAWRSAGRVRREFGPLPHDPALGHVRFHRLRSRRDVARFLRSVTPRRTRVRIVV